MNLANRLIQKDLHEQISENSVFYCLLNSEKNPLYKAIISFITEKVNKQAVHKQFKINQEKLKTVTQNNIFSEEKNIINEVNEDIDYLNPIDTKQILHILHVDFIVKC